MSISRSRFPGSRLSRRKLMLASAASLVPAVGGKPALAQSATPGPASSGDLSDYDVIIIGAGLAGMGAGQHLATRGVSTVLLEARDRTGGRCFCDNTFPAPFDFGGQFFQQVVPNVFGGTNNPLYDLYRAQGGPDIPCVLVPDFYEDGTRLPDAMQDEFHTTATAYVAAMAVSGIAAQLGEPDVSVADATSVLAGMPWYATTNAFVGLG